MVSPCFRIQICRWKGGRRDGWEFNESIALVYVPFLRWNNLFIFFFFYNPGFQSVNSLALSNSLSTDRTNLEFQDSRHEDVN